MSTTHGTITTDGDEGSSVVIVDEYESKGNGMSVHMPIGTISSSREMSHHQKYTSESLKKIVGTERSVK